MKEKSLFSGINKDELAFSVVFVFAVLVIFSVLIVQIHANLSGGSKLKAEAAARDWLNAMYPGESHRFSCQDYDTDGNNYISCSVRVGERPPMALECAGTIGTLSGCRIPRFTVPPPQ